MARSGISVATFYSFGLRTLYESCDGARLADVLHGRRLASGSIILLDNTTSLVATALRVDGCDARVDFAKGVLAMSASLVRQLLVAGPDRLESDA